MIVVILACGCRKDLCYLPHPHPRPVEVAFDWSDVYDQKVPLVAGVHFFPMTKSKTSPEYVFVDVNDPVTFYLTSQGGTVNLSAGVYAAVAYNLDTERVFLQNKNKYEELEAYTEALIRQTYTSREEGERTVDVPDYLYVDNIDLIEIVAHDEQVPIQTISFRPKPAVLRFFINVKVDGLRYANDYRGAVSNMRGSYLMGLNVPSDKAVTLLYNFDKVDHESVRAEVFTFGAIPFSKSGAANVVTLEFLLADGTVKQFEFDVSEHLEELHHDQQINLGLNGEVVLPPTSGGESGFGGDIGGWETEIVAPL